MTLGQKRLLEICKKHIQQGETTEAIEVIDAILKGEDYRCLLKEVLDGN